MKLSYPEGATPIDDISDLKPTWVKTQQELNRVEGENIQNAIGKYLGKPVSSPLQWFAISTLIKIHRDMLGDVWSWAGKFRSIQTIPGVRPFEIAEALTKLRDDVRFWCTEPCDLTRFEQAARIHHRLVFIHPFPNGNGRFSRLVSDRYLKAWRCPYPAWPLDLGKGGKSRERYISSLKEADLGNYEPLVLFMSDCGGGIRMKSKSFN